MTKQDFLNLKAKYSYMSIELYGRHVYDPDAEFTIIPTNSNRITICEDCFIYSFGIYADECIGYRYEDYGDTWHVNEETQNSL